MTGTAVTWSMDDYLQVRDLFVSQITHDEYTDWKTSQISFRLRCDQATVGFQLGDIESVRTHTDGHFYYRTERTITIFPQIERLIYTERQFEPDIFKVKPIDTTRLKIMADDALDIAERNGGSAIRDEVADKCGIEVIMLGWRGLYWEVSYAFRESDRKDFVVNVDGATGEVKR